MKIALVFPPNSLEERYGKAIAKVAGNLPPLGLLYLAAVLKKNHHDVIVLDGSIKSCGSIISKLQEFCPDIIGLSTMTYLWPKIIRFAKEIKELFPSQYLIAGGAHVTTYRKKCLEEASDIDVLVCGEGEVTIVELVETIKSKGSFEGLMGTIYRDGNVIKENPHRELIVNLDDIPFPLREIINIHDYTPAFSQYKVKPTTNILTTRGCPHKCLFCTPDTLGHRLRLRSAEDIIKEIQVLKNDFGVRSIDIWDDNFTVNRKRLIRFCKLLIEHKIDIVWSSQTRVDVLDDIVLSLMAESGCWKLHMGIESMLQKNLDSLNKGTRVEQIYMATLAAKRHNIEVEGSFIFGIPGETYADGIETINKMKTLNIDYARFFFLTPVGGELEKNLSKYGTLITTDKSEYQLHKPVFVPYSMTKEELEKLVALGYKNFYLTPKYFFKRLKTLSSLKNLLINVKGFAALVSIVSKLIYK